MSSKSKSAPSNRLRRCAPGLRAQGNNLEEMLDCYCRSFRPNLAAYLKIFQDMELSKAIAMASGAICPCCGKRHPHQSRLPSAVLKSFTVELQKLQGQMETAKDFEELLTVICGIRIHGIGPVTQYDAALRIAACLSKLPQRFVYFHGHALIPGRRSKRPLEISAFHELFQKHEMKAYEIEEFLCCFQSLLKRNNTPLPR